MYKIEDFNNPFDAIFEFEKQIAEFTGAPYCVTTDCCTHALEIAFRITELKFATFPARTYLSVPMLMHKLNIKHTMTDDTWRGEYRFGGTNIWDSARAFGTDMYREGQIQCVSFGRTKPFEIGVGGCILTDDKDLYKRASRMRYDGRDLSFHPWATQKTFEVGYHYYMRPEWCVIGLNLLENQQFTEQEEKFYNYPDCRKIIIKE
jgi:dTDP-4-amino-4,6-dideoxygalactose transaminase